MDNITRLLEKLPSEIDGVLVHTPVSRRYFTGLRSSAGTLLITRQESVLFIDFRYIELAQNTVKNASVLLEEKLSQQLPEVCKRLGIRTLALESGYTTLAELARFQKFLPECQLVTDPAVGELILSLRRIKTPAELEKIVAAQQITDETFARLLPFLRKGVSELEVALEIYRISTLLGSEAPAFSTIAVSGVKSSMPHGVPGKKLLEEGDFLTMDFGAKVDGYCADMTRTVCIGRADEEHRRVYETVLEAQRRSLAAIGPNVPCKAVDAAARDYIYSRGYEGCFGHGLGHSLGLEIHEEPRCNTADASVLLPGMTMSVEPGVYLAGRFGCRIEDIVYITGDGFVDMTHSPKELLEL